MSREKIVTISPTYETPCPVCQGLPSESHRCYLCKGRGYFRVPDGYITISGIVIEEDEENKEKTSTNLVSKIFSE